MVGTRRTTLRHGAVAVLTAVLVAGVAGCASSVPGSAHAEGEGPSGDATGPSATPAPTSGRPTVTVQPEGPVIAPSTGPTPDEPGSTVPRPLPDRILPTDLPGSPVVPGPLTSPDATPRTGPTEPGPTTTRGPTPRPRTAPPTGMAPPLTADAIRDECLLDAAGAAALLGTPVGRPAESEVIRPDGSRTRSCYAMGSGADPAPGVAVNVYRVNRGTPAGFVRAAAGGRALPGVGEAAVLLDTVGGTTLQVATRRYLITVSVVDAAPSDARWRAAGAAVAAGAERGG